MSDTNSDNPVELVKAAPADEEFLAGVYFSTRVEEFSMFGWDEPQIRQFLGMQYDFQKRSYRARFPEAEYLIIRVEDKKIGQIIVNPGAEEIRLVDVSLLPEFRGKGIGTKIIRDYLRKGGEKNLPVTLSVAQNNPDALRLYKKLGFRITGETEAYISMEWRGDFGS